MKIYVKPTIKDEKLEIVDIILNSPGTGDTDKDIDDNWGVNNL